MLALALLIGAAQAGPAAYATCQAGCAKVVVACWSAAGYMFGVPIPGMAPTAIVTCNVAFGACQAACAVVALTPGP